MAFTCMAVISVSFATAGQDSTISYKNGDKIVTNGLDCSNQDNHKLPIKLSSNPSTGYYWIAEYDHSKVKLLHRHYIPTLPILCGSGGFDVFIFIGKKGAAIQMKYVKIDEKKPIKEHIYIIK